MLVHLGMESRTPVPQERLLEAIPTAFLWLRAKSETVSRPVKLESKYKVGSRVEIKEQNWNSTTGPGIRF
ncbi:hypothetical protein EVAR_22375_1 [Eumeta japonica]|uniref:Uncharacterized protein n=1 Tax=Eumeta variegata TaxID=151549 RepID=A0A4C1VIE9_EUMVA|nr:hypothetical protein EVAR_22375_1 [Eumeta japonica]